MVSKAKKLTVPKDKVLITCSSDSFTYETFYTAHSAGEEVDSLDGQLLNDGESVEVRESLRNDGPGEKYDHTFTDMRITNKKGKAVTVKLREFTR